MPSTPELLLSGQDSPRWQPIRKKLIRSFLGAGIAVSSILLPPKPAGAQEMFHKDVFIENQTTDETTATIPTVIIDQKLHLTPEAVSFVTHEIWRNPKMQSLLKYFPDTITVNGYNHYTKAPATVSNVSNSTAHISFSPDVIENVRLSGAERLVLTQADLEKSILAHEIFHVLATSRPENQLDSPLPLFDFEIVAIRGANLLRKYPNQSITFEIGIGSISSGDSILITEEFLAQWFAEEYLTDEKVGSESGNNPMNTRQYQFISQLFMQRVEAVQITDDEIMNFFLTSDLLGLYQALFGTEIIQDVRDIVIVEAVIYDIRSKCRTNELDDESFERYMYQDYLIFELSRMMDAYREAFGIISSATSFHQSE